MNRRGMLLGAAALALPARRAPAPLEDGQTIIIDGAPWALTDIVAPSTRPLTGDAEPGAEGALATLEALLADGRPQPGPPAGRDRWGRATGPLPWTTGAGRLTTIQELMLERGAARVLPQSDDHDFIARCHAAEAAARAAVAGLWRLRDYEILDASRAPLRYGLQIYRGVIRAATERDGRVFFNFGDDFRTDVTATLKRAAFRRWRGGADLQSYAGRAAEVRGLVERINGPSIDLRHEMQLRLVETQ